MSTVLLGGFAAFAIMIVLIGAGIPVAVSLWLVAISAMTIAAGWGFTLANITSMPYAIATEYSFVVVPMFVLMGTLTTATGISSELYTAAYKWTSRIRGSLYYATTLAAGAFGAINGSSMVSAALFTRIALPEMLRLGYNKRMSAGCIAAAGTFAAMIPPSVSMIIYAILVDASVGKLLIAGVMPGLLTVAAYIIAIKIRLIRKPDLAPDIRVTFDLRERIECLKPLWATIVLIIIVMGGIYTGVIYPSTAGAAGAGGAFVIGLMRRRLSYANFKEAFQEAAVITASLFIIIIGGMLLGRALLISGFVTESIELATAANLTPLAFIGIVALLYLILGMFIDTVSLMVMSMPFLGPLAKALGVDLVWFGVITVKLIELAAITPPVGLNLFAVIGASGKKLASKDVYMGAVPFILLEISVLIMLIAFPEISLWLPERMFQK